MAMGKLSQGAKIYHTTALAGRAGAVVAMSLFTSTTTANSAHEFTVTDIDGRKVDLGQYKGKVLLVVNVASQCGELLL